MKVNRIFLLGLLFLSFLTSCARFPQQIIEIPEERIDFTVVRIEGRFGAASGFFVESNKVATNIHVIAHPGSILIKSLGKQRIWGVEGGGGV